MSNSSRRKRIATVAERLGVPYQTAQQAARKLIAAGAYHHREHCDDELVGRIGDLLRQSARGPIMRRLPVLRAGSGGFREILDRVASRRVAELVELRTHAAVPALAAAPVCECMSTFACMFLIARRDVDAAMARCGGPGRAAPAMIQLRAEIDGALAFDSETMPRIRGVRELAGRLGLRSVHAGFTEFETLLADFSGKDLGAVDLRGVPFEGIRWSRTTAWPAKWRDHVVRNSVTRGPDGYEFRVDEARVRALRGYLEGYLAKRMPPGRRAGPVVDKFLAKFGPRMVPTRTDQYRAVAHFALREIVPVWREAFEDPASIMGEIEKAPSVASWSTEGKAVYFLCCVMSFSIQQTAEITRMDRQVVTSLLWDTHRAPT
ncbi:hypothetical protein OHA21_20300 [Actinoplanes sp. NBC_00393]|uniref:hypothetical protein n=1 Tax=Actinoplanes sp. NBC_00393 TaxID=2975953 RepID=UPI002E2287EF